LLQNFTWRNTKDMWGGQGSSRTVEPQRRRRRRRRT